MLQIRLLGQFDVRLDGKRVVIPSRAGQSLFAYLALTAGTAHRREKLAGIFWPDTTDENARKNLRQELWRIRKAMPAQDLRAADDYLLADEFTILFNHEADYWLDVAILERADSDPQSLASSLSLYQGELLPGFYDDWAVLERERIQNVFETKMEQFVEKLVESERWAAVQEQCERWLALGNTPEPAFRALMLSYSARGDMAKVSSIYQRCVDDLHNQFGVEPSAETRALYNGLLKGARAPRRVVQAQPSGTVTFLFTDIEGSMRLLDKLGEQYATSLAEHHTILRAAIQKWKGSEVDTQGDSFFVTFTRALDAVQCAIDMQRALIHHKWPLGEPIRVRMGLHTGEPLIASTGYVGMDVHRAARITDAGYGGQVLLSQTTRELIMHDLPPGIQIRDLGEHRLKDMRYPTPIYQLVIDELPAEFPPPKSRFIATAAPTPGEPPFKGLHYFDEDDADWFFGRELLTAKLVNRLSGPPSASEGEGPGVRFLSVIIGASGSGKSSLVRAGLIPALKKGEVLWDGTQPPAGSTDWQIRVITPTARPLESLAKELTRHSESVTTTATLMDDLAKEPRSLALFLARHHPKDHTLLIIDQFEELFTLCRDEFEREAFIDNLLTSISPSPSKGEGRGEGRLTLIIALRADFYAHLAQYPELRDAVARQQEYIGPMTTEELRRAVEEPARRGHWEFEPGLVDLILREVGDEPGALPLLSHALLETWKRRAGHMLTLKGYADAGGVHGAIAHTAENVYQNLSSAEQTIARNIFLRLTELGEGTEDTRRRAAFEEVISDADNPDEVRAVLNILADARLVTLAEGSAEVAHEALIREWPTLREWLDEDREGLRLHRHLTEAAHDWELLERDGGALYRGAHLAQAREWEALHRNALNMGEYAFLTASINQERREEQEREAQQQRELEATHKLANTEKARAEEQAQSANRLRLRNRLITTVGAVALMLAMIALVFATQAAAERDRADQQRNTAVNAQATAQAEQHRAEEEQRLSKSRELAIAALNNLAVDPERSILLALAAVAQSDTLEAQDALHRALQASRVQLTVHHADVVEYVSYSPNGKRFATASDDGTAKIWDAATGHELLSLKAGPSAAVAFSLDGTRLATANYEARTATIWDAGTTGRELFTLAGHTGGVNQVAFSPDGARIATASEDTTAKVWDAVTGQEIFTLSGHTDIVSSVAFSPSGTQLVTGSWDHTAKVWDMATGKELLNLSNFTETVEARFSPECVRPPEASVADPLQGAERCGIYIATNSGNEAQLWDVSKSERLFTLLGHTNSVEQIVFSADGKLLATASLDGTAKVWDTASGEELLTLAGHASGIISVTFSPDGNHLATASSDSTARVWDISPAGSREWLTIAHHADAVGEVVYSPDGTRLATASDDGTAKVFDAVQGTELLSLSGHSARVYNIAFSPDGSRLATASEDNTAKVWDAITGKELLTLSGHGEGIVGGLFPGVQAVAYRPDGKQLATVGADGNAILWDAVTGEQLDLFSNNGIGITNVAFSPEGDRLVITTDQPPAAVTGEDATTQLWDLTTGKKIFTATQAVRIWGLSFTRDGKRFATAGFGGIVKIRDTVTGQELLDLSGHTSTVVDVAFSPDDQYVATASGDGTVRLWDAETGKELLTLTGHTGPVTSVSFSLDGARLATSSRDGTVRVYLLKIEELIELAKSRVTRSLATEECQKYLHVDECPSEP